MDLETLTAVFGWMTVLNLGIYTVTAVLILVARDRIVRVQSWIMGVPAADWPAYYVDYLSRYKLAIILLNLVPWLALTIVG